MTIKNPDPALEKGAELFRTAFNREAPHKAALVRIDALESPLEAGTRWFRQIFTGSTSFELFAGVSSEAAEALPGELTELLEKVFRSMAPWAPPLLPSCPAGRWGRRKRRRRGSRKSPMSLPASR
jgi:hypothetical protein